MAIQVLTVSMFSISQTTELLTPLCKFLTMRKVRKYSYCKIMIIRFENLIRALRESFRLKLITRGVVVRHVGNLSKISQHFC